jgi:hypothetical protein
VRIKQLPMPEKLLLVKKMQLLFKKKIQGMKLPFVKKMWGMNSFHPTNLFSLKQHLRSSPDCDASDDGKTVFVEFPKTVTLLSRYSAFAKTMVLK